MPSDRGLIQDVRPSSAEITGQQRELFAFDAFEYEDPNKNDPAKITVKEGWKLNLQRAVIGDTDLSVDGSFLNVDLIEAGSITANEIDVSGLFAEEITVTGSIQSENYVPDTTGWKITSTTIEIDDGIFRGNLDAAGGTFTGDLQAATAEFEYAYGRFGNIISDRLFSGTQVFSSGTARSTVISWLISQGFISNQNIHPATGTYGSTEIVGIWTFTGFLLLTTKTDTIEVPVNLEQQLTITSLATPVEIVSSLFPSYFFSGASPGAPPPGFGDISSRIDLGGSGSNGRFPFGELYIGLINIYTKTGPTSVSLNGYGAVASIASSAPVTNLPIGTYIAIRDTDNFRPSRNAIDFARLSLSNDNEYANSGTGASLAGNWRASGATGFANGLYWHLYRRVS